MRPFLPLATGFVALWLLLTGCSGGNSTLGAGTTGTGGTGGSRSGSSSSAAGVGGTSAAGMGGGSAAVVQAYCDATADAFCEAYYACCTNPQKLMLYGYGTVEDCKRGYRSWCLVGYDYLIVKLIDAGHTVFNQAGLDACVTRLKAMSTGGAACVEAPLWVHRIVCPAIAFEGQVALGEPCLTGHMYAADTKECKHGHCDFLGTKTCLPLAQLGEPCQGSNPTYPTCEWGQDNQCLPQPFPNGPPICVHGDDVGDPCGAVGACKSNYCDGTSHTCTPPPADALCD